MLQQQEGVKIESGDKGGDKVGDFLPCKIRNRKNKVSKVAAEPVVVAVVALVVAGGVGGVGVGERGEKDVEGWTLQMSGWLSKGKNSGDQQPRIPALSSSFFHLSSTRYRPRGQADVIHDLQEFKIIKSRGEFPFTFFFFFFVLFPFEFFLLRPPTKSRYCYCHCCCHCCFFI